MLPLLILTMFFNSNEGFSLAKNEANTCDNGYKVDSKEISVVNARLCNISVNVGVSSADNACQKTIAISSHYADCKDVISAISLEKLEFQCQKALTFAEESMCVLALDDRNCCQEKVTKAIETVRQNCHQLTVPVYEYAREACKFSPRAAVELSETGCFTATKLAIGKILTQCYQAFGIDQPSEVII
uniref:DUF19 domain-containing protein n=1 Tax=Meloidogyne floridensis TaxID=298350 RepID=A0A915P4C4_9BILA